MKFLAELQESVEYITEGEGQNKKHYISGLFLEFDTPNKNNRIYRSEIHDQTVKKYINEKVNTNRAFGELDHPDGPIINLKNVSHMVKEMHKEGSNWHGKAEITNTPSGNIDKGLLESNASLGVSSRGLGSLKNVSEGLMEVQPDYKLITVNDIVSDPSAHGALVKGVMEGIEWFFDENNGQWLAEESTKLKKTINKMNIKEIEEKKGILFQNFLNKLKKGN